MKIIKLNTIIIYAWKFKYKISLKNFNGYIRRYSVPNMFTE